jgi:hypothetical protein
MRHMHCTKVGYETLDSAIAALINIRRRTSGRKPKVPCSVYLCEHCGHWHLTSKPPHGRKKPWWHQRVVDALARESRVAVSLAPSS